MCVCVYVCMYVCVGWIDGWLEGSLGGVCAVYREGRKVGKGREIRRCLQRVQWWKRGGGMEIK